MKSTLFALLLSLAFQGSASGQLVFAYGGETPGPGFWQYNITDETDGNESLLFAYKGPCSSNGEHNGSTEAIAFAIGNYGPTTISVTYSMSLVCDGSSPLTPSPYIDNPLLYSQIVGDWLDRGTPESWIGEFTMPAGFDELIAFYQLQGSLRICKAGTDTDGDGVDDCDDGCPEDPFKSAPGDCGCGAEDLDSDKDGVADCNDGCPTDPTKTSPGDCGCNASDADGDGVDDCVDNCPDDPNKTDPRACGCGNEDTDTDGDGAEDCVDNCPNDPDKTEPGFCGCGTVDTNVNGDVDCDGDFDEDDALAAVELFGLGNKECPSDITSDGVVDFNDLLNVINDWGACP